MAAEDVKIWSIVAQLSFLCSYIIPGGGLIAAVLIYAILGKRDPILRHNSRVALNVAITLVVLAVVELVILGVGIVTMYATPALTSSEASTYALVSISPFIIAAVATLVVYGIYTIVAAIMNCFAISRGEHASYSYSINWVK